LLKELIAIDRLAKERMAEAQVPPRA
jgi:hypothetical protein